MLKPWNTERPALPPLGRDVRSSTDKSPNPEPRFANKHAFNPPIVTIFGAGVAGLTAAHELVERGFLVQVVEATEDPYCSGRPLVGGMAANQGARVRANVEDLHPYLTWLTRHAEDPKQRQVAQFLMLLFLANRTLWIQSQRPQRIHQTIWSLPSEQPKSGKAFKETIVEDLRRARDAYRERWLWDLAIRLTLLGDINPSEERMQAAAALKDGRRFEFARKLLAQFKNTKHADLAKAILEALRESKSQFADLTPKDLDQYADILLPSMDREMLAFELVPFYVEGVEESREASRTLLNEWARFFHTENSEEFKNHCVLLPERAAKVPLRGTANRPFLPDKINAWLELRVLEVRLPGEHGYRFFPSFYRHLDDTMRRIPLFANGQPTNRTVLDNLLPTVRQGLGFSPDDTVPSAETGAERVWPRTRREKPMVVEFRRDRPTSIEGLRDRTDRFIARIGGTVNDAARFFAKVLRFITSCPERREFYELQSWEKFIDLDKFSEPMKAQIKAASQVLLAFSTGEADARTYGDTVVQLMMDQSKDGAAVDRTLNGPTSDAWLEPWREYLERQGVRFFWGKLARLDEDDGELVPVVVEPRHEDPLPESGQVPPPLWSQDGHRLLTSFEATPGDRPDFYVMALDLPTAARLVAPLKSDESSDFAKLLGFHEVAQSALKDMTGVQLFFDAKTSIGYGHMYFPLAPWGLSSISQSEYWSRRCGFADGFMGVLSVDVADTKTSKKGAYTFIETLEAASKQATEGADPLSPGGAETYARWLVARGVWEELSTRINPDQDGLTNARCFHVDSNLTFVPETSGGSWQNKTPYLAATQGQWQYRPGLSRPRDGDAASVGSGRQIAYALNRNRWVLCGTYNATYTRMTTMEAANESARHAVITILKKLESPETETPHEMQARGQTESLKFEINLGMNKTYNGATARRVFDKPDIWNSEDEEPEDLAVLRRVDESLFHALKKGNAQEAPPHFMDICDFDKKLELAIQAAELYANSDQASNFLAASLVGLNQALKQVLQDTGKEPSDFAPQVNRGLQAMEDAFNSSPFANELKEQRERLRKFIQG